LNIGRRAIAVALEAAEGGPGVLQRVSRTAGLGERDGDVEPSLVRTVDVGLLLLVADRVAEVRYRTFRIVSTWVAVGKLRRRRSVCTTASTKARRAASSSAP